MRVRVVPGSASRAHTKWVIRSCSGEQWTDSCAVPVFAIGLIIRCFHLCSRDTVKAKVFGSHIAAPTMTLEEFGDQQKADALDRQQREQDGRADGTSAAMNARRYHCKHSMSSVGDMLLSIMFRIQCGVIVALQDN